jgi:hypothetical protein
MKPNRQSATCFPKTSPEIPRNGDKVVCRTIHLLKIQDLFPAKTMVPRMLLSVCPEDGQTAIPEEAKKTMINRLFKFTLASAVGLFGLGLGSQAQAAPTMLLCLSNSASYAGSCGAAPTDFVLVESDGTNAGTTIVSNGVAAVLGTNVIIGANHITFQGTVDGWTLNVSTGVNGAPTGGVDLNSIDQWNGTGSHNLDIFFQNVGNFGTYGAHIGGTNPDGGTTNFDGCINPNSLIGAICSGVSSLADVGAKSFTANGGFSANYGSITGAAPFGLFEELGLVATTPGTLFSGDYQLTAVPEPTSILLLGGVLALAGRSLRKKYQKAA